MKIWQRLLCGLAWRVLWRWWHDRVVFGLIDHPSLDRTIVVEVGTPQQPDFDLLAQSRILWVRLDHPGQKREVVRAREDMGRG